MKNPGESGGALAGARGGVRTHVRSEACAHATRVGPKPQCLEHFGTRVCGAAMEKASTGRMLSVYMYVLVYVRWFDDEF